MKNVLLVTAMLFMMGSYAQEKTEALNEKKIGWVTLTHYRVTDESGSNEYIYISYQNLKYKHITDWGGFILSERDQLNTFASDITKCKDFISTGEKAGFRIQGGKYTLNIYDFAQGVIYITDTDKAYTSIEGDEIQMIIDWLSSVSLTASL